MSFHTKEELMDRAALVDRAEAQAHVAEEWRVLAARATPEQLLSLPTVGSAMSHALKLNAESCDAWAQQAEAAEDRLLARALRQLGHDLRTASVQAAVVGSEAEGYAALADDE